MPSVSFIENTYSINTAVGSTDIVTPAATRRLFIVTLFLQAEADVAGLEIRSSGTNISGPIDFTAATALERTFNSLYTRAVGDPLRIVQPGTVQINGFVTVHEIIG